MNLSSSQQMDTMFSHCHSEGTMTLAHT